MSNNDRISCANCKKAECCECVGFEPKLSKADKYIKWAAIIFTTLAYPVVAWKLYGWYCFFLGLA